MSRLITLAAVAAALACAAPAHAAARRHPVHYRRHQPRLVAYDAKDRRYYSVAWARAHGMHDRGGDRLVLRVRSSLPRDARLSRAMHGHL